MASLLNTIIIEGNVNLRSRHELLEIVPQVDSIPSPSTHSASLVAMQVHPTSKYPMENLLPKGWEVHVKSKEFVDDSSDEVRDEGDWEYEARGRGRSMVRMDKGKGRQKDTPAEN